MEAFILKMLDSILSTLKTVLMIKNKGVLSALASAFATFAYTLILVDWLKALQIAIATFLGSIISFYVVSYFEKDKVWVYDITPMTNEDGKEFADLMRENNIPIRTYIGFNNDRDKVLCSKVYSQSKEHSRIVMDLIPETCHLDIRESMKYIER